MTDTSPDGRFEIIENVTDDDSYFYSDRSTSWHVSSKETGDELTVFSGSTHSGRDGSSEHGVKSVAFDETGGAVLAIHHGGKRECYELPSAVELADEGRAVKLTYRDGRTETRKRDRVLIGLKFGGVIAPVPLVGDPTRPPAPQAPPAPAPAARLGDTWLGKILAVGCFAAVIVVFVGGIVIHATASPEDRAGRYAVIPWMIGFVLASVAFLGITVAIQIRLSR
jgi:hypothetical protein